MKLTIISIALASFLLFSSSRDNSPTSSSMKSYKYTGYDSSWNKIIERYLWIDSIDSMKVKGGWRFELVSNSNNISPQVSRGSFEGTTNMLGTLSLNLNPGMIDNNVLLECSMRLPYRIDGQWSYIDFPGVINWGRFEGEQLR